MSILMGKLFGDAENVVVVFSTHLTLNLMRMKWTTTSIVRTVEDQSNGQSGRMSMNESKCGTFTTD